MLSSLLHVARWLRTASPAAAQPRQSPPPAQRTQRADALAASVRDLRHQHVQALRGWLGEDHELVRDVQRHGGALR